jgi:RNA polymerase sigma-70 factor (ECF subfamily)
MSDGSPVGGQSWPATRWSLVDAAGRGCGESGRAALEDLLKAYQPAMRSHLMRRRRIGADEADDLLQSFLLSKVLERAILARADRSRGRFRAFLKTALDHFALNEARNERSRNPAAHAAPLDEGTDPPDATPTPQDAFDVEWAREVIRQAVEAMKGECERSGRPDVWGVFEARTLGPILEHREPAPYGELVERFQFGSPAQASNVLVTANRMFARNLRSVIARYESHEEDVGREVDELRRILSRAGR